MYLLIVLRLPDTIMNLIYNREIPCSIAFCIHEVFDCLYRKNMVILILPFQNPELEQQFRLPLCRQHFRHCNQDLLSRFITQENLQHRACLYCLSKPHFICQHVSASIALKASHNRVDLKRLKINFTSRQLFESKNRIVKNIHRILHDLPAHIPAGILELIFRQLMCRIGSA